MLTITGLVLRFSVAGCDGRPLGGPAVYAGLAAALSGHPAKLAVVVGSDLTEQESMLLDRIGSPSASRMVRQRSTPVWRGRALLGDAREGAISEDLSPWSSPVLADAKGGLVCANADPSCLDRLIAATAPPWVAFDCHSAWLRVRREPLLKCLARSNLVTMTEHERDMLPREIFARARLGEATGPALVVKKGARGIEIVVNGMRLSMPPPQIATVRCDIGAGDMLLGALAACLKGNDAVNLPGLEQIAAAYERCRPLLTMLLSAPDPAAFIARGSERLP